MADPQPALSRNRALTWKRAAVIGWRDLKSAPAKFGFVVLSVAIGVAALVGVRGFSESFRHTLAAEARSLIAGDFSARIFHVPTAEDNQKIDALKAKIPGSRSTWVTETLSMASVPPDPVPILVALKAVNPAEYPYYGKAILEPDISLRQALAGDSAVVADEFLVRLNAHVGDTLRLGGLNFKIAAVLRQEPDRISAGAGMGPRVMISSTALARTGILGPGSRASHRLLLKLPDTLPAELDLQTIRKQLEQALGDVQVIDYREGSPALTEGLDRAGAILSLICLVAMVLGAIGVAMAMHAHLEQRMDMLAILKAVGAGSPDLLCIFLLQTLGLGLAGGLLGVAAGLGVMEALPAIFGKLMPVRIVLNFPWRSVLAGLGTGLLTTLLFCLPPLLDVRAIRPVLVLRRLVEQPENGIGGWFTRLWKRRLQLSLSMAVVLALGGIAWGLSDSAIIGTSFAFGLAAVLLVLLVVASVTLRTARFILNRVRLHLPSFLRHGLANLYRPGNQSSAVLAALGTGLMLILAVYLMQSSILRELRTTASPTLPNVFLIDVSTPEAPGVKVFFQHQPGVSHALDLMPAVTGKFVSLNGTPVAQLKGRHYPHYLLRNAELSWSDTPPAGDKVTQGKWWTGDAAREIAISEGAAQRLQLGIGSQVEIETPAGGLHKLKVAALYKADGEHVGARIPFVLPPGELKNDVATWYGGVRLDPKQIPEMERAFFLAYPTVTVINIADILTRIETVVDQITVVIRFLAGFSILAGLTILASSIASTRFRRIREAVVLKTLGATRMRIVRTFSVEFSVLGLLAGMVGVIFANILIRVILHRLKIGFQIDWAAAVVALFGTAILATATGWIASYRILGLRPLEVLREE
jgi:putative ABC transport system permease protein